MTHPVVLATIPGQTDNERLLVLLSVDEASLMLCSQTWADGVGWFTQGSVRVDSQQLGQLRAALGRGSSKVATTLEALAPTAGRGPVARRTGANGPAILAFPAQHVRAESA